jgi:hypothetical protein
MMDDKNFTDILSPQSAVSPTWINCSVSDILSVSVSTITVSDFSASSYTICV